MSAPKRKRQTHANPHRQTRTTTLAGKVLGLTARGVREAAAGGDLDYIMVGSRMYVTVPSIERKLGGRSVVEVERGLNTAHQVEPPYREGQVRRRAVKSADRPSLANNRNA